MQRSQRLQQAMDAAMDAAPATRNAELAKLAKVLEKQLAKMEEDSPEGSPCETPSCKCVAHAHLYKDDDDNSIYLLFRMKVH